MSKAIIRSAGREKYDINIESKGWTTDLSLGEITDLLRDYEYSEIDIKAAVEDLLATKTAILRESIQETEREQHTMYKDTGTIVDPKAIGDSLRPITILLKSEVQKYNEEEDQDIILLVYWEDSDIMIYEETYPNLEEGLTDYNMIEGKLQEIHKLLSIDQHDEAEEASEDLLRQLELGI